MISAARRKHTLALISALKSAARIGFHSRRSTPRRSPSPFALQTQLLPSLRGAPERGIVLMLSTCIAFQMSSPRLVGKRVA